MTAPPDDTKVAANDPSLAKKKPAAANNTDPPNPGSDAFHARLGFHEVGRAFLADRGKSVRYLEREV